VLPPAGKKRQATTLEITRANEVLREEESLFVGQYVGLGLWEVKCDSSKLEKDGKRGGAVRVNARHAETLGE